MRLRLPNRRPALAALLAAVLVAPPPAVALLNIDGSRNQIFVFGRVNINYDSNIFSDNSGRSDIITTASVGAELKRRRGIIAVNAIATFDYVRFADFNDETGWNPSFQVELNKTTGKTTGALTVNAYRTNRSDSAVNIRTTSWNLPIGLNIKYPVNERLYLTSTTGYLQRSYSDNEALVNYTDYTQGFDAFYVYNSRLDMVGGYRVRVSRTSLSNTADHLLSFGATGGLLPKVNGTLRLGYQQRSISFEGSDEQFGQFTVLASVTWIPTRKLNVLIQATRDFTTTAVGGTVDTFSTQLSTGYSFSRRLEFNAGLGYGRNRFVGGDSASRQDDFLSWNLGAGYTFSEKLKIAASYSHFINWSMLSFSDFERTNYSLEVSSRF